MRPLRVRAMLCCAGRTPTGIGRSNWRRTRRFRRNTCCWSIFSIASSQSWSRRSASICARFRGTWRLAAIGDDPEAPHMVRARSDPAYRRRGADECVHARAACAVRRSAVAFDADNDKHYLNHILFADHGALLDPSTADVTARCVSFLAQVGDPADAPVMARARMAAAGTGTGRISAPLRHHPCPFDARLFRERFLSEIYIRRLRKAEVATWPGASNSLRPDGHTPKRADR